MSITLESYIEGEKYIEFRWDKYAGYEVLVGHKANDGIVYIDWENQYGTKEQGTRSYKRQVAKAKKGW